MLQKIVHAFEMLFWTFYYQKILKKFYDAEYSVYKI